MKISKEGIALYFMKISEMRDQLQELGEFMSDREMTIVVLNALPTDWGNFTSSIYAKKESIALSELWYLCKIEETRLKEKEDVGSKEQAFSIMTKKKGKIWKILSTKKKQQRYVQIQCFGCQDYIHYKRNFPKLKKNNYNKRKKEEAHMTQDVKEEDKKQKKEDPQDLSYD